MEERRLLLAVALSLLVLTAYQMFFAPAARSPAARSVPSAGPTALASPPCRPRRRPRRRPPSAASPAPAAVPRVADERERRVEVEGEDLLVAFANKGARLLSWQLKHYRDARGRPEEMVLAVGTGTRSLDLETGNAEVDQRLREALFRPSVERLALHDDEPGELRFDWAEGDLEAQKVLRVPPPRATSSRWRAGSASAAGTCPSRASGDRAWATRPRPRWRSRGTSPRRASISPTAASRACRWRRSAASCPCPRRRWVGIETPIFRRALGDAVAEHAGRSPGGAPARPGGRKDAPGRGGGGRAGRRAKSRPGSTWDPRTTPCWRGPATTSSRVVNVGDWIGPLVVPLMALLRWAYAVMGNYGWAIVLLTVLINLAMAPFRHYSIANGLKMAEAGAGDARHPGALPAVPLLDPKRQEMQQEIGELYARHGMNMGTQMLVGCLPILLTMPFLIAFYTVLQVSIELRGASFIWIPDLSQKDPFFITPVLMGLSMFLMQKMVPTTMDPAQQRIMMIMPVVLSGMFLWAPAGLNLYWLCSNLCSIVQQGITMRLLRDRTAPASGRKERRRP